MLKIDINCKTIKGMFFLLPLSVHEYSKYYFRTDKEDLVVSLPIPDYSILRASLLLLFSYSSQLVAWASYTWCFSCSNISNVCKVSACTIVHCDPTCKIGSVSSYM